MPDGQRSYRVSSDPLPEQSPLPEGVQDWVLSFDLERLIMKVRQVQPDQPFDDWPVWHFKEAIGKANVTGTDEQSGRINIRGECMLQGDTLYFWR